LIGIGSSAGLEFYNTQKEPELFLKMRKRPRKVMNLPRANKTSDGSGLKVYGNHRNV